MNFDNKLIIDFNSCVCELVSQNALQKVKHPTYKRRETWFYFLENPQWDLHSFLLILPIKLPPPWNKQFLDQAKDTHKIEKKYPLNIIDVTSYQGCLRQGVKLWTFGS